MDNTSNNFFFGNQQFYIPQDSPASPCYTSQLSPFGLYDSLLLPNAEYSQSAPHTTNGSLADELAQMQQTAAQILQQSTVHQQQLDLLCFPELNLPYDNFPTTSTSSYPTGLSPSLSTSDQNQPARSAPQASSSTCVNDAKDEEPLYVNAKQYHRIMHRRAARARLEEVHRLAKERKPYMHESRHKHACRRPRGAGGRFLTADELKAMKYKDDEGRKTPLLEGNSP